MHLDVCLLLTKCGSTFCEWRIDLHSESSPSTLFVLSVCDSMNVLFSYPDRRNICQTCHSSTRSLYWSFRENPGEQFVNNLASVSALHLISVDQSATDYGAMIL